MIARWFFPMLIVVAGCSRDDTPSTAAPVASASSAAPRGAAPTLWHLIIDPKSVSHVEMTAPSQHFRAETSGAQGALDVAPTDLARTRGAVTIDLYTLATRTFGNEDDEAQTKAAGWWLETVGATSRKEHRWASFAIQSVDGLSAPDLTKVTPVSERATDTRTVTLTAHGDLLIHGHKATAEAAVVVAFHHSAGAPAESPPRDVTVVSASPMRVRFADIDVRPRDAAGKLVPWSAFKGKVSEGVEVTVELKATPAK